MRRLSEPYFWAAGPLEVTRSSHLLHNCARRALGSVVHQLLAASRIRTICQAVAARVCWHIQLHGALVRVLQMVTVILSRCWPAVRVPPKHQPYRRTSTISAARLADSFHARLTSTYKMVPLVRYVRGTQALYATGAYV